MEQEQIAFDLSEEDIVSKRLRVIQLAEVLGSVSEACKQSGMDRTSFYEWKKRYHKYGVEGLKDLPPIHRNHPQTTPSKTMNNILEVSKKNPTWGCVRISEFLKEEDIKVSSPTIQKILIRNGMGKVKERVLELEKDALQGKDLNKEQIALIEKMNSPFKERKFALEHPGQILFQDSLSLGIIPSMGRIYIQVVIDPYSFYTFATLHKEKNSKDAVHVLHKEVLPFFTSKNLTVNKVITDNGAEYTGKNNHPFDIYLDLNEIDHDSNEKSLKSNGFIFHFKQVIKDEFFRKLSRVASFEELQEKLRAWLQHFNNDRSHNGFPNMGKTPNAIINGYQFLKNNS